LRYTVSDNGNYINKFDLYSLWGNDPQQKVLPERLLAEADRGIILL